MVPSPAVRAVRLSCGQKKSQKMLFVGALGNVCNNITHTQCGHCHACVQVWEGRIGRREEIMCVQNAEREIAACHRDHVMEGSGGVLR